MPVFRVPSHLLKKDRTGTLNLDDRPDDQNNQNGSQAAKQTPDDIHDALDEQLQRGSIIRRQGNDVEAVDLFQDAVLAALAERNADMHRDGHLAALLHQEGDWILILIRLVFLNLQLGHRIGVEEDLVHPLATNIIGSIRHVRHDGQVLDHLALGVPVGQDKANIGGFIQAATSLENARDVFFTTDQDHFSFFEAAGVADQIPLPQEAGQVGNKQIQNRRQKNRDTAVGLRVLRSKKDHSQGAENGNGLFEGLAEFHALFAMEHVVHGVEEDADERVESQKNDRL